MGPQLARHKNLDGQSETEKKIVRKKNSKSCVIPASFDFRSKLYFFPLLVNPSFSPFHLPRVCLNEINHNQKIVLTFSPFSDPAAEFSLSLAHTRSPLFFVLIWFTSSVSPLGLLSARDPRPSARRGARKWLKLTVLTVVR